MPQEAFRDFWETIKAGNIWSAVIKNRRKNGDTYWVRANATAMYKGSEIIGYLSVRTRPEDKAIADAEALYALMREEAGSPRLKRTFKQGQLQRPGLVGILDRLIRATPKTQAGLCASLPAVVSLLAVWLDVDWWLVLGASALACAFVWRAIDIAFIRPASDANRVAKRLASGDLTEFVRAPETGNARELLLAIGQLALATRTVMKDVRSDLASISTKSSDLATSGQELSRRTEAQANSLTETAAAIAEISNKVEKSSDATREGVAITQKLAHATNESMDVVGTATEAMRELSETFEKINDFTRTIESIAFQTNILALNAAVEAAGAGEHGRGFAVVASEVRTLSQRATAAASEIGALISESEQQVKRGVQSAGQAASCISEATSLAEKTTLALEEINQAAQEQAMGVRQINAALKQLDEITQNNATLVGDLAETTEIMNREIHRAYDNLQVFRIVDDDITHAQKDAVQLRKQNARPARKRQAKSSGFDDLQPPVDFAKQRKRVVRAV